MHHSNIPKCVFLSHPSTYGLIHYKKNNRNFITITIMIFYKIVAILQHKHQYFTSIFQKVNNCNNVCICHTEPTSKFVQQILSLKNNPLCDKRYDKTRKSLHKPQNYLKPHSESEKFTNFDFSSTQWTRK